MKKNEKHGKHVYYDRFGDTTLFENYKNDQFHGVKRTFYKGGKIHKHVTYSNGIINGPFYSYNKEGKFLEKLKISFDSKSHSLLVKRIYLTSNSSSSAEIKFEVLILWNLPGLMFLYSSGAVLKLATV